MLGWLNRILNSTTVFRRQVQSLLKFGLKNRYRNTLIGVSWVLFQPLAQFAIQAFAFAYVLKIDYPNYTVFLLSGLLPWLFIVSTIDMTIGNFINHAYVFKAISINPAAFLVAQALDNFLVFNAGFFVAALYLATIVDVQLLGLWGAAFAGFFLLLFVTGVSLILSIIQVFFRDFRYVINFVTSALFFATPISYPLSFVDAKYRSFLASNPAYIVIQPFRDSLLGSPDSYYHSLLNSAFMSLLVVTVAYWLWNRLRNSVVLNV
jgi:ABC-type polysaccharide/polyol phosphate export permease